MYSFLISTIVYLVAAHYVSKIVDDFLPKGILHRLIVFIIATIPSWLVALLINWMFPSQAIHLL